MRSRHLLLVVMLVVLTAPAAAQVPISKARPATVSEDPATRSSRIPETVVSFGTRAEARSLPLASVARTARALRGPKFPEAEVQIGITPGRHDLVGAAKADVQTGKVWLALVNDGLGEVELGFAGFKSPGLSHTGTRPLESVSVAATAIVRRQQQDPGTTLSLDVRVYADGIRVLMNSTVIDGPGDWSCTVDGLRLEPGVTYHAVAALRAHAGQQPGNLVAATDAEISAIRWSF